MGNELQVNCENDTFFGFREGLCLRQELCDEVEALGGMAKAINSGMAKLRIEESALPEEEPAPRGDGKPEGWTPASGRRGEGEPMRLVARPYALRRSISSRACSRLASSASSSSSRAVAACLASSAPLALECSSVLWILASGGRTLCEDIFEATKSRFGTDRGDNSGAPKKILKAYVA